MGGRGKGDTKRAGGGGERVSFGLSPAVLAGGGEAGREKVQERDVERGGVDPRRFRLRARIRL